MMLIFGVHECVVLQSFRSRGCVHAGGTSACAAGRGGAERSGWWQRGHAVVQSTAVIKSAAKQSRAANEALMLHQWTARVRGALLITCHSTRARTARTTTTVAARIRVPPFERRAAGAP